MTKTFRRLSALAACSASLMLASAPASAQIFWKAPALNNMPATGMEPELGLSVPGANAQELRAALVWNLRAALNVAALQCDFDPTLLTVSNYNATIAHHRAELASAFSTLGSYFQRTAGAGKAGQNGLDRYGTRIYSSYSAVQAQKAFCNVASRAGREAIFADRGNLYQIAQLRLPDIRRAFADFTDKQFFNPAYNYRTVLPNMKKQCWKRDVLTSSCSREWAAARISTNPQP